MKPKIKAIQLLNMGYTEGPALGLALQFANTNDTLLQATLLQVLAKIQSYPENYILEDQTRDLAKALIAERKGGDKIQLRETAIPYIMYGAEGIEETARRQMDVAMKLPITRAGALMPDAHPGYGLPIGGVLATQDAIIPYGVGVDIGCRMALSVFDITEKHFNENQNTYKNALTTHTKFGAGQGFRMHDRSEHEVLSDPLFKQTPLIKNLYDKAAAQLGTSGGGNHFVEWGIIDFEKHDEELNIDAGRYLALLTHSGSRGLGATLAGHYTRLAKQLCKLPKEAANLAYLDIKSEVGIEYWDAMNLAGRYASACHQIIHEKMTRAIGGQVLVNVENHHNFAWKEQLNGAEVIVHRKGATPATRGVLGIIPGSMTAPGFLVRGKGAEQAINSAAHGAGRLLSRTKANETISREDLKSMLQQHGVSLIGAGPDEAPMAYKDIHKVMAAQEHLVETLARFEPKMVRMADDGSRED